MALKLVKFVLLICFSNQIKLIKNEVQTSSKNSKILSFWILNKVNQGNIAKILNIFRFMQTYDINLY